MKHGILAGVITLVLVLIAAGTVFLAVRSVHTSTLDTSQISSFAECKNAGYPVTASYPAHCRTTDGKIFTEDVGNSVEKQNLIQITSPHPNDRLQSPLEITGQARGTWYFEASFPVQLLDANGNVVARGIAQAQGDWMTTDFVPFVATLTFSNVSTSTGTLRLMKDNPSGLPQHDDEMHIPIVFASQSQASPSAAAMMTVDAYFNNQGLAGSNDVCTSVFPVPRYIPKVQAVGTAAIDELLKGPTASEQAQGYTTSLPSGVRLQSLTIKNEVATADFNEALESGVVGSCRVAAIRWQISQTLKQFSTVKLVVISINGRTADILQP